MKANTIKSEAILNSADKSLLSLVASKLKDKVLFPEKTENAKKYLQKVKLSNP
jgi:hypothetical protein